MSNSSVTISDFMTEKPHSISESDSVYDAMETMERLGVRHLPVLENNILKGLLTERDVKTLFTFAGTARNPKDIPVGDVCTCPAYVVGPETPLTVVASMMAEHKYGCAVVMKEDRLVGIFTVVDACRVLADLSK
jgi:acetoin utilization protein AcuB